MSMPVEGIDQWCVVKATFERAYTAVIQSHLELTAVIISTALILPEGREHFISDSYEQIFESINNGQHYLEM